MVVITKLDEPLKKFPDTKVRLKYMGNVLEVRQTARESRIRIQKLSKDEYVNLETGEICTFEHGEKRTDNIANVRQSLRRLTEIINTNIDDVSKVRWITLTYKENMTDPKRLYNDFRKFNQRLKYYLEKNKLGKSEYIVSMEVQARGAWHAHLLLIFEEQAPFIPNETLRNLWGHGFVKITSLNNVDNIGLYLTAYLSDMEVSEVENTRDLAKSKIKRFEDIDEEGKSKAIVKGARLRMYPVGFNIYRTSKGIKMPVTEDCTWKEAQEVIGDARLTYEKSICIEDDAQGFINKISYQQYNKLPKLSKQKNIKETISS